MKLIIAGGRDYILKPEDYKKLEGILDVSEIVHGCAPGADQGGENFAFLQRLPVKRFPADWTTHGRAAGPIRNLEMAQYADALALFPGGKGTRNMHDTAKRLGLEIFDFR